MISLQSNSSGLLTKQSDYIKLNSYINSCLNKFESCENGVTIVFNVTVNYNEGSKNSGKTVLASSGGDSPYAIGGFYLHQFSAYNDNYLEFGISLMENLFVTQVGFFFNKFF